MSLRARDRTKRDLQLIEATQLIAGCLVAIAVMQAAVLAWESLYVALFASAEEVASYHFGSEAMVAIGGLAYESPEYYVGLSVARMAVLIGASAAGLAYIRSGGLLRTGIGVACFVAGL